MLISTGTIYSAGGEHFLRLPYPYIYYVFCVCSETSASLCTVISLSSITWTFQLENNRNS